MPVVDCEAVTCQFGKRSAPGKGAHLVQTVHCEDLGRFWTRLKICRRPLNQRYLAPERAQFTFNEIVPSPPSETAKLPLYCRIARLIDDQSSFVLP